LPKSFCLQPNKTQLGPYLFHLFPALSPLAMAHSPHQDTSQVSSPLCFLSLLIPLICLQEPLNMLSNLPPVSVLQFSVYGPFIDFNFFFHLSPPHFWSLSLLPTSDGEFPYHLFLSQLTDCLSAAYCWWLQDECSIHFVCCTGVGLYI